jgi:hypothetical protein
VSGIGKQCQGIAQHAIHDFDAHEAGIQDDSDQEGPAKIFGRMDVSMSVIVVFMMLMVLIGVVMLIRMIDTH